MPGGGLSPTPRLQLSDGYYGSRNRLASSPMIHRIAALTRGPTHHWWVGLPHLGHQLGTSRRTPCHRQPCGSLHLLILITSFQLDLRRVELALAAIMKCG